MRRWQAYKIWVTGLTYSPDGSLLASSCGNSSGYSFANDHSIHLWNADLGTLQKRLPRPPPSGVHALAFDPTGHRVVAGDDGGTVYVWDVDSGETVRRENLDDSPIRSAVFANGGRHVVVGHLGGTVGLIDLEGKGVLRRILMPSGCARLAVDDRSQRIVVGDPNGGLSALTLPDLTVVHQLAHAHADDIFALTEFRRATPGHERARPAGRPTRCPDVRALFHLPNLDWPGEGSCLRCFGPLARIGRCRLRPHALGPDAPARGTGGRGSRLDQPRPAVAAASGFAPGDRQSLATGMTDFTLIDRDHD